MLLIHFIDCFFIGLDAFWRSLLADDSKQELQQLLFALHESVQREDARHRFDLRCEIAAWAAHNGQERWDTWVEYHRTHPEEANHAQR